MNAHRAAQVGLSAVLIAMLSAAPVFARDAAFLDPGTGASNSDDAVRVEPKGDIDTGESILNVAKRITLFFVNQTNHPVQVQKVAVNGDGNVATEITNDDCSKQGNIPAQSRCSVEVEVTPSSPGVWSVDVLMTHDGAGRIARSKVTGKTTGSAAVAERKDTGLALSTKEAAPVTFGDVAVGAKAVRSALMVNDSPDTISIYSIDVIEAGNGLQKLDQGCAVDMELKPGESCPVTLVWMPQTGGQISTDLIIRHSGRLGFAVIPIRGNAKGEAVATSSKANLNALAKGDVPPPPSAQDLEKVAAGHIPALSTEDLGAPSSSGALRLIGTVGTRAVILKPDGDTDVIGVGEEFDAGTKKAKLVSLTAKAAIISLDGRKKEFPLTTAPELTARAHKDVNASTLGGSGQGSSPVSLGSSVPLSSSPLPLASAPSASSAMLIPSAASAAAPQTQLIPPTGFGK